MDTRIDIDQDLVRAAMAATGQTTMRDAVEEALRRVVLLDLQRQAVAGSQGDPRTSGEGKPRVESSLDAAGPTAHPSRFRKALGTAGPGETTDEIMQWLRPTRRQEVLGPESESFADAAARLRAQSPAQTTDSADLLRAMRDSRGDPLVIERVVEIIETARAALTPEQERAVDAFLKEIGAA